MFAKIKFFLFSLFLLSYIDLNAKDNKTRLSLGGGIYNFMKHGSDDFNQSSIAYNTELFSGKRIGNIIMQFVGFLEGSILNQFATFWTHKINVFHAENRTFTFLHF